MDFRTRKIQQVLQMLTTQDIYKFQNFLESPYFLRKEAQPPIIALFQLLTKRILTEEIFDIPDDELAVIFPKSSKLDVGKLEKSLSHLNSLFFQYLAIENINNSQLVNIKTAEVLRQKNAQNLWESLMKKNAKAIQSRNNNSFQNSLELLSYNVELYTNRNMFPLQSTPEIFSTIIDSYNEFYSIFMLNTAIKTIAHNKFYYPIELQSQFTPLKLMLASDNNIEKNKEKFLLYKTFNLLIRERPIEIADLEEVLANIEAHFDEIGKETKINIYTIVKNCAIRMYNLGDTLIGKFIFKLYKDNVKNNLLFHGGKIQIASFFNIVKFAIDEKEFDWLQRFLTEYEDKIFERHLQKFVIALSQSKIYFAQKEFEKALKALDYNVVLPYLKGMARMLEIMSLFELKSQQIDHKVEAFKIYMHRVKKAKVSPRFQKAHNNFIGILRSINHPKTDFDLKRIEKIISKINATEILAERKWLMEKCEEKAAKIR